MTTRTPSPAAEPVDLLLVAALAVAEALAVLAVAALALVLTLTRRGPAALPQAAPAEPMPAAAPPAAATAAAPAITLADLADLAEVAAAELEALPVAELRRRARAAGLPRSITRTGRRAALVPLLAGLDVALA